MNKIANILIVDDNPAKLESVAAMIENDYLNIVKVEEGYAAVYKANETQFALILLDVSMPGLDGYETASMIRSSSKNSTTPIIFITDTYFAEEHKFKGYSSGAVDYLTTPFVPKIVKSKVDIFVNLFRRTKKLEQVLAKNEKFYSIIAHDLRSPFHPLLGLSQILMDDADKLPPEEINEISTEINRAANKLLQLLNDLLELTRLRSEDFIYAPTKVKLKNVVEHVFDLVSSTAGVKKIALCNQTEGHLILADKIMLQTIIQNLVSNAIKFTPAEGMITVSSKEVGDSIEINVTDNGIGIKPENFEKLFASDVKFTTTGTNQEIGTGLGLSICKELAETQNGSISVRSEIGKGTTFTITLPKFEE